MVHAGVSGRLRLKVYALHRSLEVKSLLETALPGNAGIRSVSANALSGNALIVHDVSHSKDTVIAAVIACLQPAPTSNPRRTATAQHAVTTARAVAARPLFRLHAWHSLSERRVAALLDSDPKNGLSSTVAAARLLRDGSNSLPAPEPPSALRLFLEQFATVPVALLGASAAISLATGGVADALVIAGVVLTNAGIGYFTESGAQRSMGALTTTVAHRAAVWRDGAACEIAAAETAVGDVLMLTPGAWIAADARLLTAAGLSIDESALTGESLPVQKAAEVLPRAETPLAERHNMVYSGTLVTGGSGRAMVVATGVHTEMGQVRALVNTTRPPPTPMQRQLDDMGRQLAWVSGGICGVVFVLGLLRGYGLLPMLKSAVSLAVAAVPEGLPTVATTTLALGLRALRKEGVLIRHLGAVETLGAVQVICMDKTGTLTINRMTVVAVQFDDRRLRVDDYGFYERDQLLRQVPVDLLQLAEVCVLCNDSEVITDRHAHRFTGTPTENALLALAASLGVDIVSLRARYPRRGVRYRSNEQRYMATEHEAEGGRRLLCVKGSPAEVLALCAWVQRGEQCFILTEMLRAEIVRSNEAMAGESLRVLGIAYGYVEEGRPAELVWLGLVGMTDPVRAGARELIGRFHEAGIDTVMITGDQSATAQAIGRALHLARDGELEILDSSRLEQVDPELLSALALRVQVFARVSPTHKLQIVQALQRAGRVVAMTGDGINDSPALRAADIGIAMGDSGTVAAREVADVVLEHDDLQTMLLMLSRGRSIYQNIRKAVHYLLATNLSEIVVMGAGIGAGLGQPLSPMQLLWINLISDIAPGLALAVEPPEPDVLRRPPRDPQAPIVAWGDFKRLGFEALLLSGGALAAHAYGRLRYGPGAAANGLTFVALSTGQILHALSCRSERHGILSAERLPPNPYLTAALGGSLAVQGLALTLPALRRFLGLGPLGPVDMLVAAGGAAAPLFVNELTKSGGRGAAILASGGAV